MIERAYTKADAERVADLHRLCGFEYELPDLEAPSFLIQRVIEDEGQIAMAGLVRMTAEVYLLADTRWRTPMWRYQAMQRLEKSLEGQTSALRLTDENGNAPRQLEDVFCWMPPEIERSFGKRLSRMGWQRQLWAAFSRRVI